MPAKKPTKKPLSKAKAKLAPARRPLKKTPAKPAKGAKAKVLKPVAAKKLAKPARPAWLPTGYRTLTPRLVFRDCGTAIDWYLQALGAEEIVRHVYNGMCMHAELKIGDSRLHLNDAVPTSPSVAPTETNPTTCSIDVYVADCDGMFERAVQNGAIVVMPMMDAFWGDRCGVFRDPFGHVWMIASRQKALSKAEIDEAAAQAFAGMPTAGS